MKHTLLLVGLFLSICSCKTGSTKATFTNKKVEVVNPDYGIL